MKVGILTVGFVVPGARTLKEKRKATRSVKDRVKNRFNVSIAEVDGEELWQRGTFGVSAVSNDAGHAAEVLENVKNFIEKNPRLAVTTYDMKVI